MITIQYASDLHLESIQHDTRIEDILTVDGHIDILVLAGDICSCGDELEFELFKLFIEYYHVHYTLVVHVAGNHEYYSSVREPMDVIRRKLHQLEEVYPNYKFLDNSSILFTKDEHTLRIVGSTLWSNIPVWYRDELQDRLNDHVFIWTRSTTRLTMKHRQHLYVQCKQYLKQVLAGSVNAQPEIVQSLIPRTKFVQCHIPRTKFVLVTHHQVNWDEPRDTHRYDRVMNWAFQNKLEELLVSPVILAIHGHTHIAYDKYINGVHVVSNPHGYPSEQLDFCKYKILTI